MDTETIIVISLLITLTIIGLCMLFNYGRELKLAKLTIEAYATDVKFVEYQLSEMEAAYRDSQIAHMQTTMNAEELQHSYNTFVDIVVNEELNRLDKLYYSERLDQVIEFRELTQIGEL